MTAATSCRHNPVVALFIYFYYYRNMDTQNAVAALGALAQETRLKIFRLLVQAGQEGLAVGRIAELLETEPNGRLSFHLKELVNAGLASTRQAGRFVFYTANYPAMNALLAYLTEQCCGGLPCGSVAPVCPPENSPLPPTCKACR